MNESLELFSEFELPVSPTSDRLALGVHGEGLFDFQRGAITALDAAIRVGRRAPLLCLPTGSGKTVIAAAIARRVADAGGRSLFLAPRRELILQASAKFTNAGVTHGVVLAGADHLRATYARAQVASIDTLLSRIVRRRRLTIPDPDVILIDECHLAVTALRQALFDLWPHALRIGLTATPCRLDGRALGALFDELLEPTTTARLTREGFLTPAKYFSLSEPDLARVRIVAGDFHKGELEHATNQPRLVADIVRTWLARAATRRTVCFATSVAHSVALADAFQRAGVAAEHCDATTPAAARAATFERFTSGATQVLTNVNLASLGFDLPQLDCVIQARPTKSLALHLQQIGRALRRAEGKADALILDHSGNVHRFGLAEDERRWTLQGDRALVEPEPRRRSKVVSTQLARKQLDCPVCQATFSGSRVCPNCGYTFRPPGREVVTLDGELVQVGVGLDDSDIGRLAFFLELRGIGTERQWKPGAAAYHFRDRFNA